MTSHPSSDGNLNKFIPGLRAVLPILLVVTAVVLSADRAGAQTITNFQCSNQIGADLMQVIWSVDDTCGPFDNLASIEVRVDGIVQGSSMAPNGSMAVGPITPGSHMFELTAFCTSGSQDNSACFGMIECYPQGLITTLNCNANPGGEVNLTWVLPSSLPTYYTGMFVTVDGVFAGNTTPGSPVFTIFGVSPGPHDICLETTMVSPWQCGPMACCVVTIPGAEICNNGIDDDGDNLIDCADPDCAADPACATGPCSGVPGTPCDDGDPCTEFDVCDGNGNCIGTPVNCDDNNPCTTDACDALTGCVHLPIPGCEDCTNGIDDDGDGLVDCEDPDCIGDPFCIGCDLDNDQYVSTACGGDDCDDNNQNINPGAPEICFDGIDNDCDLLADCADPDCAADPACSAGPCSGGPPGSPCDDGDPCTVADVCDGTGTCIGTFSDADFDGVCDAFDICPGFDDNLDSDGDGVPDGCDICPGSADTTDTDNDGVPDDCDCDPLDGTIYPGATEICDNNVDDDCDGPIDCADPDCVNDPVCSGGNPCTSPMDCDDLDPCTIDECLNGVCVNLPNPACGPGELCNNGIDDDGDMLIDCEDPDCFTDPACQVGTCSITNIAVGCDTAGSNVSYSISFDVINDTPFDVTHIFVPGSIPGIPGSTLSPTVITFSPPLLPGTSGTVLLSLSGGSPFLMACFPVGLMAIDDATGNLFQCCATQFCAELPPCDACLEISAEGGAWGAAAFGYDFTLTNLAGTDPAVATYAYLVPTTPGVSVSENWFDLGGLPDGLSTALATEISGAVPLQEVCFLVTIHDATLGECCGFVHCFTLPPLLLPPAVQFLRGDANADGSFDVSDVVTSLDFIFQGDAVHCVQALDSNDDESVNIADAVFSLAAIFTGGAEPAPPGAVCGLDETSGTLGCEVFPACDEDNSGSQGG